MSELLGGADGLAEAGSARQPPAAGRWSRPRIGIMAQRCGQVAVAGDGPVPERPPSQWPRDLDVWLPDGDGPAVWATRSGDVSRLDLPGIGPTMATLTSDDATLDDPGRLLARVVTKTGTAWLVFAGTGSATTVHVPTRDGNGYAIAIAPAE